MHCDNGEEVHMKMQTLLWIPLPGRCYACGKICEICAMSLSKLCQAKGVEGSDVLEVSLVVFEVPLVNCTLPSAAVTRPAVATPQPKQPAQKSRVFTWSWILYGGQNMCWEARE